MLPRHIISVALSSFCIVISLIIYASLLMESKRQSKLNRLFRAFILGNLGYMSGDVVGRLLAGNYEWHIFLLIRRVAMFIHYVSGPLLLAAMTFYLLTYIELKKVKVLYGLKVTALAICGTAVLLTVVSQFNNMYYLIDQYNVYHRGELMWLSQALPTALLFINILVVFFYRKVFKNLSALFFVLYMALPVIAIVVQFLFFGITYISIALTLITVIFYIRIHTEQVRDMASHIQAVNQQLEMQRGQYARMIENDKHNKAARHDIRHHLAALGGLADAGSAAEIKDYLTDLIGAMDGARDTKYCENLTVNAVVSHYLDIAKDEGGEVSSRFVMPEEPGNVSAMDLCVVLGNLLENAVEACRRMDGGRFIRANSMVKGTALFITIDNSHSGRITKNGDTFMSSKREGEGIGISSVKAIAQKYDGEVRFDAEDGVFKASVMLRIG